MDSQIVPIENGQDINQHQSLNSDNFGNSNPKVLKNKDYVFFSVAQFASSAISGLVQGYMIFFYTVCVGIPAVQVGTMFLIAKILAGLTDPTLGVLIDHTKSKWGKMRPYLFLGALPWGILTVVMFLPFIYLNMQTTQKIIFMWFTYIAFNTLSTIISIPMQGLPTVASPNIHERTKIISVSRIVSSIGEQSALVLLTLFLLVTKNNYLDSYMSIGIIIGVLGPVFMVLGGIFVKERVKSPRQKIKVTGGFEYLFKNKQLFFFFLSNLLSFFRNLVSSMIIYIVTYIYSNGSLQIVFALPGAAASMIGMLMVPKLRKKIDSKRLFIFSTIWHSIALAGVFFMYMIGINKWWIVAIMMFVAMIPVGILNVIPQLMATDTLDYWEDRTGIRYEGITFALMNLRSNIASGLKDFVLMFLLVFFGFSQALPFLNQHQPIQSDFTKLGMFAIYTIIPASLNLVSIVPILFYRLSGKRMAEIHKRLEEKRAVRETKNSEANIGDIEV